MIDDKIRPSVLARRMHVHSQDVTRLLKISHTTKIDTLEQAFNALGKQIVINVF